jgi:hypothetical protein
MRKLKTTIRKNVYKLFSYRHHIISNQIANKILKTLENQNGKLPKEIKEKCDFYAKNILGWSSYAPWLYVYTYIAGEFKVGWLPDNYYRNVVIPKIQGNYGKISNLKPLTNRLFQNEYCPDIGYYLNGTWFDKNYNQIPKNKIKTLFFSNTKKIICKLDSTFQGKGVFVYDENNFSIVEIENSGDCVLQKFIQQHSFFNQYVTESVATIRLTTVVDTKGEISLRASYLRLGRADNTHVQSDSHIRVPINKESGILHHQGFLPNWIQVNEHPDTNVVFKEKKIPDFNKAVELVLNMHKKMPMVACIGWDLIIDSQNKPIVMEWNGFSNDIKFSEATQGPCFKDLNWNKLRK